MIIGISGKKRSGKDTVGKLINYHLTGGIEQYESLEGFFEYYDDGIGSYPYDIKKFAGNLKEITSLITGYTIEELEDEEIKNKTILTRYTVYDDILDKSYIFNDANKALEFYKTRKNEIIQTLSSLNRIDEIISLKEEYITPRTILQVLGTEIGRQIHPDIWINALMKDYSLTTGAMYIMDTNSKNSNKIYESNQSNWIITDVRFPNEVKAIKDRGGIVIRINRKLKSNDNHISETALDDYKDFDYTINNYSDLNTLEKSVNKMLKKLNIQ